MSSRCHSPAGNHLRPTAYFPSLKHFLVLYSNVGLNRCPMESAQALGVGTTEGRRKAWSVGLWPLGYCLQLLFLLLFFTTLISIQMVIQRFISSLISWDSTVLLHSSNLYGCSVQWHIQDSIVTNNYTNFKIFISNTAYFYHLTTTNFLVHLLWFPYSSTDLSIPPTSIALHFHYSSKLLFGWVFISILNQFITNPLHIFLHTPSNTLS